MNDGLVREFSRRIKDGRMDFNDDGVEDWKFIAGEDLT